MRNHPCECILPTVSFSRIEIRNSFSYSLRSKRFRAFRKRTGFSVFCPPEKCDESHPTPFFFGSRSIFLASKHRKSRSSLPNSTETLATQANFHMKGFCTGTRFETGGGGGGERRGNSEHFLVWPCTNCVREVHFISFPPSLVKLQSLILRSIEVEHFVTCALSHLVSDH